MPLTPLHYPLAYLIYKVDRRFVLPGLIVGSMFPDVEVPVLLIVFGFEGRSRLILHSLIGAIIIGTLFSLLVTVYLYPYLVSVFFQVRLVEVKGRCRLSLALAVSCLLGNLSHVLLDYTNHNYNPLFWPLTTPKEISSSPICHLLGGVEEATLIIQTVLAVALLLIIVSKRGRNWESLLIGDNPSDSESAG